MISATKMILDEFTRETERLRLRRVRLDDLGGRKGQLTQHPGLLGAAWGTTTRTVLSEGEQTALGLAGSAEAVFDKSKSAVIFDDPVTSLDHVRDKVAQRLAQLAADRQVVVFTHDVAFVGDLTASAEERWGSQCVSAQSSGGVRTQECACSGCHGRPRTSVPGWTICARSFGKADEGAADPARSRSGAGGDLSRYVSEDWRDVTGGTQPSVLEPRHFACAHAEVSGCWRG